MARDALPTPLQESVLTTLCFDVKYGALVAAVVEPDHFDEPYREIARRVLDYRKQYRKPPGQAHLDDLFGTLVADGSRRAPAMRRIIFGLAAQAEGLNAQYVATRVGGFVEEQRIKQALYSAGQRYQQGGEGRLEDVKAILHTALSARSEAVDTGTFLHEKKALSFLDKHIESIPLGIPALDRLNIGPVHGEMLLYIGPKGTGKSWFAVHSGKQGFLNRQKVCHVTNEIRAARVIGRYYQALFGIAHRPDRFNQTVFEFDTLGRWAGMDSVEYNPNDPDHPKRLNMRHPEIKQRLRNLVKPWGARLGNIVIKEYPTSTLSIQMLTSYLDFLEQEKGFLPTMLIVDSPDLMRIPISDFRLGTRRTFEELRGVAGQRSLALVATTQGSRASIDAKHTRSTHVAEDIGKVQTADNVLAYSSTRAERRRNLGRLTVEHARNEESGTTVLLAQSYQTGQYVLQSAYMPGGKEYWDKVKEQTGEDAEYDE